MTLVALPDRVDPQTRASDPRDSVFVAANAGSGKTSTLVKRVARLLLAGSSPAAILCVTFTKAAAAEMQTRLFQTLGAWAVADDAALQARLAEFGEPEADLSRARALFARALETPGGLKIQTLHSFCEAVLRRFPLESGLSPGFTVLDDLVAAQIAAGCREATAEAALADPQGPLGAAYARMSVELGWDAFNGLFATFQGAAIDLRRYLDRADARGGHVRAVWRRCGFPDGPTSAEAVEQAVLARLRPSAVGRALEVLSRGTATDQKLAACLTEGRSFAALRKAFCRADGGPRAAPFSSRVIGEVRDWLLELQDACVETCERLCAVKIAEDSVAVLTLAITYLSLYEAAKEDRRALDYDDIIARTVELLTVRSDAAWVLYKLDGGVDHVLLDEAQDTAPAQWEILRALTAEFFVGAGQGAARRTVFAVGDEKQSIFSFQGAAPDRMALEAQRLAQAAVEGGARFQSIPLRTSYRSAPQILAFVDAMCAIPAVAAGLSPSQAEGLQARHVAFREDAGCVELWPLEPKLETQDPEPWAPVDAEPPQSPNRRLAARIAREIRAAVERGDAVGSAGGPRPCRWGDFLILVRRRNALFHEIIRALKREGAPVAGADRFVLSEHGVFEDLMALARIARFPGDDLTLAALLRGPFCDVSEESLFDLAWKRPGRLVSALHSRAGERAEWRAAADLVTDLEALAAETPDSFSELALSRLDGAGRSMRQRLMTRMGIEGEEALLAFLIQSRAAEERGVLDLESFVAAMATAKVEIKRDAEAAGERVRVMTVHGAKGLEAPIVILPDTTTRVTDQGGQLFADGDGGFLWAPRKQEDCVLTGEARERRSQEVEREAARLLYVAITRARDRLIIAGAQTTDAWFERSWRFFVEAAWPAQDAHPITLADGASAMRLGPDPLAANGAGAPAVETARSLPAWARSPAAREPGAIVWAGPSKLAPHLAGAAEAAISPLTREAGLGRYRRGDIIHRLLERLPDVPPADRAAVAARLLGQERDLTQEQRAEMTAAAFAVLNDSRFAEVFGPGSRAEVAVAAKPAGLPGGVAVSGRIDRLVVLPDRVLVADYKTNRPAPARIEDADPAYLLQMAAYVAVLKRIFPGRQIEAALVWTDGPRLMVVPPAAMADALRQAGGEPGVALLTS
ncbi:MAG TPA: double-strand break repair helicase AddA [Caulobacteraceae bacterium]|jgi:ATP-dependent helicase/nuclease subunit A|nr:double-strand break repair helicase AddA [Caulobacteraceae bacterium]